MIFMLWDWSASEVIGSGYAEKDGIFQSVLLFFILIRFGYDGQKSLAGGDDVDDGDDDELGMI